MATKNRIAYALPIIQIMWRLLAKSPIQNCLRLVYGERVGVVPFGLDVPKNPVFMRVSGLGTFRVTAFCNTFATLFFKNEFSGR